MQGQRIKGLVWIAVVATGLAGVVAVACAFAWPAFQRIMAATSVENDGALPQAVTPVSKADHGAVNIGFAQDMSLHHEQALFMARLALAHGSPRVRAMADGIVNQQLKEIGYMQGWLMLWDAPSAANADDMRWMKAAYEKARRHDPAYEQFIASCSTGQGMPGMATADELENLSTLHQAAFDRMFLALMVRHHQGAVVMARFTAEHAESEAVRGFARAIAAEQRREMAQMMTMLAALQRDGTSSGTAHQPEQR